MLRNKTGKKFAVSRPVKRGVSSSAAALTPPATQAPTADPQSTGVSNVSSAAPLMGQPGPQVALRPAPDATQQQPVHSATLAQPPVPVLPSPSETQRPLFFPEPTPPPTADVQVQPETTNTGNNASANPASISAPAPARNAFALPLAPQMPNPFLHPQVPPPIPSSSLAPPTSFTPAPTSFVPPPSGAVSSRPSTQPNNEADNVGREAEKEKRRIRRRQKQGQEGSGRAYRTTDVEPAAAGKRKRAGTSKQTGVDGSVAGDDEDPEAQLMREEAEGRQSVQRDGSQDGTDGDEEDDEETDTQPGQRRRGRQRKNANDDIDLDGVVPGDALGPAIDSNSMTMGEIAAHPGFGRVSSRGLELQQRKIELAKEKRGKLLRRKSGREGTADGRDPEDGQDDDAEGVQRIRESSYDRVRKAYSRKQNEDKAKATEERLRRDMDEDDDADLEKGDKNDEIDENDEFRNRAAAPAIRIDDNGDTVLDESSLQIESGQAMNDFDTGAMEVIEEHDKDRFINASSYQRKPRGTRWTREETDLLFEKTREFGTSFDMILHFFPGKTRRHVINQWNRLCKNNDPRADWAYDTAHKKAIDFSGLEQAANMTFSTRSIDDILKQQEEEMQAEVDRLIGVYAQEDEPQAGRQHSPTSSRGGAGAGSGTDGDVPRPKTAAELARQKAKDKRASKKAWKDQYGGGEEIVGTVDD
ncbi:hypothetical protein QFC21_000948 [Naganishia friedmannii]|uniref:Uncharacterized protein n=1 Tax=Naganishia friedmannii TaxID=89922 RepID=A0ACC2W7V1_9TREE|nr:hypothetical protein QFC21_000948 [Naganishia friedmannii]